VRRHFLGRICFNPILILLRWQKRREISSPCIGTPLADPGVVSLVKREIDHEYLCARYRAELVRDNLQLHERNDAQFKQEIDSLGQQGKLSLNQQVLLEVSAVGGDSVPVSGPRQTTAQALSDPTLHNFISEYQNIDYQLHHTPGAEGAPLVDSLLQTLEAYQGSAVGNSATTSVVKTA